MKICICCSLSFVDEVNKVAEELKSLGHEVLLPNGVINRLAEQADFDPVQSKIDTDSCHKHADKIRESDAILVCNYDKNSIANYIGANSFAEMFVANYFNKSIYTLRPLPDQPYINDEIQSFGVIVINDELTQIK